MVSGYIALIVFERSAQPLSFGLHAMISCLLALLSSIYRIVGDSSIRSMFQSILCNKKIQEKQAGHFISINPILIATYRPLNGI